MMKQVKVPLVSLNTQEDIFKSIERQLDWQAAETLDNLLWSTDGYKPDVRVGLAHNGTELFVKYMVQENEIRAVYNSSNDPVYRDSCVEFFIGIGDDAAYYNLEFNIAGACSVAYGNDRHHRQDLPVAVIQTIRTQTHIRREYQPFTYSWSLTAVIPASVFMHNAGIQLDGLTGRANFYKCGDDLLQPHFLAWNPVAVEQPNFHLPEFFGQIQFQGAI